MGSEIIAAVIAGVVTVVGGIISYFVAEAKRKREEGKREGTMDERLGAWRRDFDSFKGRMESAVEKRTQLDGNLQTLASEFHEFKTDIKEAIRELFKKFDVLMGAAHPWPCEQIAAVTQLKTFAEDNRRRLANLEKWQLQSRKAELDEDSDMRHCEDAT